MAEEKKKASGVNIPEAKRNTTRIVLRVPPEVAERFDELVEEWGITKAGAFGRLIAEFDGEEPD